MGVPGSLRDALHNVTLASDDEQLEFLEPTFLTRKSEGEHIFQVNNGVLLKRGKNI